MATYEKPKRKNTPIPQISIFKLMSSFVSGVFYYGLVVPTRWIWRQLGRVIQWTWQLTKQVIGWIGWQIGFVLGWTWWLISTILQKTVFAPFIMLGRLLGFVAGAIPDGLSPEESEIYQRINRNYRRQKRWYLHVISFLIGMLITWFSLVVSRWDFYPRVDAAVMFTLIWFVLLGTHRLWMNLGDSEDHEIGEALHHLRNSQQAVYYEEELYEEPSYDPSRLEDTDYDDEAWVDDEHIHQAIKAKRQRN